MSVAVLDSSGAPWAWAGRHRLAPRADGDSIDSRATGYYVVLEARRHSPVDASRSPGCWSGPTRPCPTGSRSLAELFRQRTEVGLIVHAPGAAPDTVDVFDYDEPTTAGRRLLFSVRAGAGRSRGRPNRSAYERRRRAVTWLALAARSPSRFSLAPRPIERLRASHRGRSGWPCARRSARRSALQPLFSPATFFRPCSGRCPARPACSRWRARCSLSPGVWLWRRRLPRRWYGSRARHRLLLRVSPTSSAAWVEGSRHRRTECRSASGSSGSWRFWCRRRRCSYRRRPCSGATARAVNTSWRTSRASRSPSRRPASESWSGVHAAAGRTGTPGSGRRRSCWSRCRLHAGPRSAGIALVAGSSSALVTWGAELSGKIQVAATGRRAARRGADPLAVPLLERFGEQVRDARPRPLRPRRCTRCGTARRWVIRAIRPTSRSGTTKAHCSTSWPSTRSICPRRCCRPWCERWSRATRSASCSSPGYPASTM